MVHVGGQQKYEGVSVPGRIAVVVHEFTRVAPKNGPQQNMKGGLDRRGGEDDFKNIVIVIG